MTIPTSFEQVTNNSPDGAQMGRSTSEKNAFYGSTPVVQPTSANQAAVSETASNPTAPAALTAGALTENSTQGTPNTTIVAVGATVTLVDVATTGNAAESAAINTRMVLIDDNFADLAEMVNKLTTDADAARTEQLTYETAISALVVDITASNVLTNQLRSELVTLGLIKGS